MKFKIVRHHSIKEEEADQVIDLANWGMARKLIAIEVYGSTAIGEPTQGSLMRVHHILRDYGIRVTDYRNGRNRYGKATIAAIRREADVLGSIRAAQKEVAAALVRKTG